MKERQDDTVVVPVEKTDNVLAYCPDCRTLVFHGNDDTTIKQQILRRRVFEHLDYWGEEHGIDVIYPRKEKNERIIEGKKFTSNPSLILDIPKSWLYKLQN